MTSSSLRRQEGAAQVGNDTSSSGRQQIKQRFDSDAEKRHPRKEGTGIDAQIDGGILNRGKKKIRVRSTPMIVGKKRPSLLQRLEPLNDKTQLMTRITSERELPLTRRRGGLRTQTGLQSRMESLAPGLLLEREKADGRLSEQCVWKKKARRAGGEFRDSERKWDRLVPGLKRTGPETRRNTVEI